MPALGLLLLGGAICAALWATGPPEPLRLSAGRFLAGYTIAWLCYLLAGLLVARHRDWPRWTLVWLVAAGLAMRLVCLARTPPLSTDVWRYLWDGRVANAGINPFQYAPTAPELRHLRDQHWRGINFREVPTIYPPAAQGLFALLARARAQDAEAFRWAFALFDLSTVLLLIALLSRTGRPPEHVVWYAWCPLAATEATAGAHVDAFGVALLITALLVAARAGPGPGLGSALALAGAVMAKGYAVLVVPFFVRRAGWRWFAIFAIACLAMVAPFAGAGGHLLTGLRAYLGAWHGNASLFLVADRLLRRVTPAHFAAARALSAAGIVAIVTWLTWRLPGGQEGLLAAVFAAFAAQLALGAPAYPWYALWLIPSLCWWRPPALVLLTFTISAQYYARWLYPNDAAAHWALLWAGYGPVYALLLGQAALRLTRRQGASAAAGRP